MRHGWMLLGCVILLAVASGLLVGLGTGQAQVQQGDLEVSKSVSPETTAPGETVVYTVVLTNRTEQPLTISSLTDTLAEGFEYVGLTLGSEWSEEPDDNMAPLIQWTEPIIVPAADSLTLRYLVYVPADVPLSPEPYNNTIVATVGSDEYTDEAGLLVAEGEASLAKAAMPTRVQPGGAVTYTLSFSNSGYVPLPLAVVTDVLPSGVTWLAMTGDSDVQAPPDGATGSVQWDGPFSIPSHAEFVVEYQAAMPMLTEPETLENTAWGRLDDGTLGGPATARVVVSTAPTIALLPLAVKNYAPASFAVAKSADPTEVYAKDPGGLIAYTVSLTNEGTEPGELAEIRDTLPAGFTFQRMLPGSDVDYNPSGTTGEIVWTGPFPVEGQQLLTLIYEVRASTTLGTYVNSVTATATVGRSPQEPASAAVRVRPAILFEDDFNDNAAQWTPFLNLRRLDPGQWWWQDWGGYEGGAYVHSMYGTPLLEAHDALSMALVPGSENWTDYRYEARINLPPSNLWTTNVSLWFRGNYQESDVPGQWVLGYYFLIYPRSSRVAFMQTATPDDCYPDDCQEPEVLYHFSNPIELVEQEYPLGELWFGTWHHVAVEVRGNTMTGFIDGVKVLEFTDTEGTIIPSGTVGLAPYRAPLVLFDDVRVTPLD